MTFSRRFATPQRFSARLQQWAESQQSAAARLSAVVSVTAALRCVPANAKVIVIVAGQTRAHHVADTLRHPTGEDARELLTAWRVSPEHEYYVPCGDPRRKDSRIIDGSPKTLENALVLFAATTGQINKLAVLCPRFRDARRQLQAC